MFFIHTHCDSWYFVLQTIVSLFILRLFFLSSTFPELFCLGSKLKSLESCAFEKLIHIYSTFCWFFDPFVLRAGAQTGTSWSFLNESMSTWTCAQLCPQSLRSGEGQRQTVSDNTPWETSQGVGTTVQARWEAALAWGTRHPWRPREGPVPTCGGPGGQAGLQSHLQPTISTSRGPWGCHRFLYLSARVLVTCDLQSEEPALTPAPAYAGHLPSPKSQRPHRQHANAAGGTFPGFLWTWRHHALHPSPRTE